jgi:hypothetical protein
MQEMWRVRKINQQILPKDSAASSQRSEVLLLGQSQEAFRRQTKEETVGAITDCAPKLHM